MPQGQETHIKINLTTAVSDKGAAVYIFMEEVQ